MNIAAFLLSAALLATGSNEAEYTKPVNLGETKIKITKPINLVDSIDKNPFIQRRSLMKILGGMRYTIVNTIKLPLHRSLICLSMLRRVLTPHPQ